MHRQAARCLIGILLAFWLVGCEPRDHLIRQHLLEFGTIIEITLIHDDLRHAERLLENAEQQLKRQRRQWHAWEDSDLTRFNDALQVQARAKVPSSLRPLLQLSQTYYQASDGLFNPAMGRLIAAYGFHNAPADERRISTLRRNLPIMTDLSIDGETARSANPDLQIDLGGIAKGYAIGEVAALFDRNGIRHYVINAGGDLVTQGSRFGKPWRIGIRNPYAPGVFASIELSGRNSLFTSGNYARQYQLGKRFRHHIIDPRSGESSVGQSSATVLTRDPALADAAATILMIDGGAHPRRLARSLGTGAYLIVTEARQILASTDIAPKLDIHTNWPLRIIH